MSTFSNFITGSPQYTDYKLKRKGESPVCASLVGLYLWCLYTLYVIA